ncbi:hypothetical protein [Luethyella okanaganae]|uniref:Glycosyl hydrolase family 31 C-terminal domain-containing protein n=1 Tax=Luethyella okanaganae TaxID=69372 RepID=A0ABW1VE23_9MICO
MFRSYARLRERLVPYLVEQVRRAVQSGAPLMRALYFDHPHDDAVWEHPLQWLLGDDLLVAPVLEPGRSRWPVYLPAGSWVDVWTGESFDGGAVVDAAAPLERIPVFARSVAWERLRDVWETEN